MCAHVDPGVNGATSVFSVVVDRLDKLKAYCALKKNKVHNSLSQLSCFLDTSSMRKHWYMLETETSMSHLLALQYQF